MTQRATVPAPGVDEPTASGPSGFRRPDQARCCAIDIVDPDQRLPALLKCVPHPSFDDPALEGEILAPMPQAEEFETSRRETKVPRDSMPELAPLFGMPILSKDQEQHLFRKMNYLKYKASRLTEEFRKRGSDEAKVDPSRVRLQKRSQIERLVAQANQVKEMLIRANLRLVVHFVKRYANPTHNFFDLLSDGNLSLLRAVELFDYSRNIKFGTYAVKAILMHFNQTISDEKKQRARFATGHEVDLDWVPDNRTVEQDVLATQKRAAHCVNRLLDYLEPREREIIRMRAGLDGRPPAMTLEEIGRKFGITKERVRQLNEQAMKKLRGIAEDQQLDLL